MKRLLSTKEASKITGYCEEHIRRLVRSKKLKAVQIEPGARYKFLEQDLFMLTQAPQIYPTDKERKK